MYSTNLGTSLSTRQMMVLQGKCEELMMTVWIDLYIYASHRKEQRALR